MPITDGEIMKIKVPFKVAPDYQRGKNKGTPNLNHVSTVTGFSESDPLDVGLATVYFQKGGWIILSDLMRYHSIVNHA